MVDPFFARRWLYRLLFVSLAIVVLFLKVMPVTVEAGRWPGPDVLLALALCWGMRRPEYLPPLLVGAVFLTADLILQRPPGLWAALMVLALEFLRSQNALWRDLAFPAEWAVISAVMAVVVVGNWLLLAVFMVDQAAIGLHLIQLFGTVLVYPLVVLVSALLLGVRKVAPGAWETVG